MLFKEILIFDTAEPEQRKSVITALTEVMPKYLSYVLFTSTQKFSVAHKKFKGSNPYHNIKTLPLTLNIVLSP